jgi:sugar phosphate isomerase/epimerase
MTNELAHRLSPSCVFSKHLHWVDPERLGAVVADLGFDGIDLTVRPDGHVKPERVREDLPRLVRSVRASGLEVPMLTTAICSAHEPYAEDILRTAADLEIPLYRMGWLRYRRDRPIAGQLPELAAELRALVDLNRRCGIRGAYQNHAGAWVGAAVWDLWVLMKEFDSAWLGVQYDVRHAMVESAHAWVQGLQLIGHAINSLVIKDYAWRQVEGRWKASSVPLGNGAVEMSEFLSIILELGIAVPVSVHYEYPLGGADQGARSPTVSEKEILDAMRRDLLVWRDLLTAPATPHG